MGDNPRGTRENNPVKHILKFWTIPKKKLLYEGETGSWSSIIIQIIKIKLNFFHEYMKFADNEAKAYNQDK